MCLPSRDSSLLAPFYQLKHSDVGILVASTETIVNYRVAENFQGRKLSQILWFCGYTRKLSPQNLGYGILWHGKSEQSTKLFSAKIIFSPIHAKVFYLESFPLYSNMESFCWTRCSICSIMHVHNCPYTHFLSLPAILMHH